MGYTYVTQAGLELLGSGNLPTTASQVTKTKGAHKSISILLELTDLSA